MNVKNKLLSYTKHEKENFKNGKILIAFNNEDITNFISKNINIKINAKLYYGKLNYNITKHIEKELNINLLNFNLSLQAHTVKHILNNHGKNNVENNRNQTKIEPNDFILIPTIISNFDKIYSSKKIENNNDSIVFQKIIKNHKYILICYISLKKRNLEVKTLYKIKKKEFLLLHLIY